MAKNSTRYNIEMDAKAFFSLSLMLIATAAVIFYLGVSFGKAARDPDAQTAPVRVIGQADRTGEQSGQAEPVYKDNGVDRKRKEMEKIFAEFNLKAKQDEGAAKEKQSTGKSEKSKTTATTGTAPAGDGKLKYTVQVLATSNQAKAKQFVESLKKKKFEAYLLEYPMEESKAVIYRVRVGKVTKGRAEELQKKLTKTMKGMRTRIYQVRG